jgi:hypothetical protein
MKAVRITGRFVYENGLPVQGIVRFIPNRIWVDVDGLRYACLAPEVILQGGRFDTELTRTDTGPYEWYYTVVTPMGEYKVRITKAGPLRLKDLIARKNV